MSETNQLHAYVGTYTSGASEGIYLFDADPETGALAFRKVIPERNPSYLIASRDKRFLYAVSDMGVVSYHIEADGDLTEINRADIGGMRGHHLAVDREDQYLFVAGYHDGRVSMMELHDDGSLGELKDGIFHRGQGAVNERSFNPHISCVRVTPDNRFLCAVDVALDQVVLYEIHPVLHKLKEVEIVRMGREVGPRSLHFSQDGTYAYLLCELSCTVRIYRYSVNERKPSMELIDEVSILAGEKETYDAASAFRLRDDDAYLFCSAAGSNTVTCFAVNQTDGTLDKCFVLPTSGNYPKDVAIFPDGKHLTSVNNGAGTLTTFTLHYEEQYLTMKGKPVKIDQPNCMIFV